MMVFLDKEMFFLNVLGLISNATGTRDRRLANSYASLQSLLESGMPIRKAVELAPLAGVCGREAVQQLDQHLSAGKSLSEFFENSEMFPFLDQTCLAAAEKSGHLPEVLGELARTHERVSEFKRRVLSRLAYPVFLLHFAAFVLPITSLISKGAGSYGFEVAKTLLIFYLVLGGMVWLLIKVPHSSFAELYFRLPIVGRFRRDLELASFTRAFHHLYEAGVEIVQSYKLSADSVSSSWLRERLYLGLPILEVRETVYAAFLSTGLWAPEEKDILNTGEVSGRLGEAFNRLTFYMDRRGEEGMVRFSKFFTGSVYFFILLWVAAGILGFYRDYFNTLSQIR